MKLSRRFGPSPWDVGPFTPMAAEALMLGVSEAGRVVNVHTLFAVEVNTQDYWEIPDLDVTTAEDGAGWSTSCSR